MKLTDTLSHELDLEARYTRETLNRVPEDKFARKAHEKSFQSYFTGSARILGVPLII
jgi:hypothetical protein